MGPVSENWRLLVVIVQIAGFQSINIPVNSKATVLASLDLKMLEVKFKSYTTKKQLKCKTKNNVLIQGLCPHYCGNMLSTFQQPRSTHS